MKAGRGVEFTPKGRFKLKLQVMVGDDIAFGPGKADLLRAIEADGSISAAARSIGMSYRRAWSLVDVMNRCWSQPVVEANPGAHHGANLTDFGRTLLCRYGQLEESFGAILIGAEAQSLMGDLR